MFDMQSYTNIFKPQIMCFVFCVFLCNVRVLKVGKRKKNHFFWKNHRKNLADWKKGSNFALELRNTVFLVQEMHMKLGYGVMVTLQILVLPFLVRVRIPQQRPNLKPRFGLFCFHAATHMALPCHTGRTIQTSHSFCQHKKTYLLWNRYTTS